jgi:hypothetical protein
MSNPTIRFAEEVSFPDIEIAQDIGNTIDITSVDALDMGLLANQKKIGSPARASPRADIKAEEIEFVNLDDVGKTNISMDVRPNTSSFSAPEEPIRLVRDSTSMPPPRPIAPVPQPAMSLSSAPAPSSSSFGGIKNWFGGGSSETAAATESGGSGGIGGGIRSWFSSSSSSSAAPQEPKQMEYLTPEQEFTKKTEALTQLERMDRKGITGNKMTMANSLDEINAEVERRKDSKALEASIRFQRSMLTTVTNGMEFLNSRFDPLGVKLDGWSEQVNENIEDYDEIFEELYDKYKDKSKVAPEVRLIMSLGLSAAMCHVTNTMFKSKMPGMDDILRNNPDLARQFAQAAASQAVGPGFANFVGMGMSDRASSRRPSVQPQAPPAPMYNPNVSFGGVPPSPPAMATARREMRGPSGVEDILRSLGQAGEDLPDRSVPPPASPMIDAEEVHSVRSGFTTATERAAGRSRRRTTAQPVGATLTLNV